MKEASWDDCINDKSSIRITPDRAKAISLIDTSKGRIDFVSKSRIDESNANYIFENYYTSIIELLQAIVILEGFGVNNHICLGFFLRDITRRENLFRIFDDCRFKRNSLVYYGKKMDFEKAKEAIEKANALLKELSSIVSAKLGR